MAAFVEVKWRLGRHGAGVPDLFAVMDIIVFAIGVYGNIVITITGNAEKLCVFVETVASAGVGDQRKEIVRSKIVDPGKRSVRGGNDIFFGIIVKMSEFHDFLLRIE